MIKVGILSLSFVLLAACGDAEPVATSYKKSMASGGAVLPATGAPPAAGADAALVKQGSDLYGAKCAPCHDPLATSKKKGATAARITAAATITSHASVTPYPTATDATALAAALK